jgi:hypothetical protein
MMTRPNSQPPLPGDRYGIEGSINYHNQRMAEAIVIPQLRVVRVRIGHVSELGMWRTRYIAWFENVRTIYRHEDGVLDLTTYDIYRIPEGAPDRTNYCLAVAAVASGLIPTGYTWESHDRVLVVVAPPP